MEKLPAPGSPGEAEDDPEQQSFENFEQRQL